MVLSTAWDTRFELRMGTQKQILGKTFGCVSLLTKTKSMTLSRVRILDSTSSILFKETSTGGLILMIHSKLRIRILKRRNSIGNSMSKTKSQREERKGKKISMMLVQQMKILKNRRRNPSLRKNLKKRLKSDVLLINGFNYNN